MNSIEKIDSSSLVPNGLTSWTIIQVPQDILIPRNGLAVSVLNDTKITILGGGGRGSDGFLGDIIVFDTKTDACKKAKNSEGYKFHCYGNHSAQAGVDKIVALVQG